MPNRRLLVAALMMAAIVAPHATANAKDVDWTKVAEAFGKEGTASVGDVYRISLPRSDLKVTLDGIELKPGFALGGWLAFEPVGQQVMVMGDLVLLEGEVNPVMEKLLQSGLEVTAIHNHLLRSRPTTMFMHVMGRGDPVKLARQLHDAIAASKTPLEKSPRAAPAAEVALDVAAIDNVLGAKGKINGPVLQYSLPRAEGISVNHVPVPPALGSAIAINFQPTGNGKAAITGDFVLIGSEVNPVLHVLRENGIEVTALHSHMVDEQPRLYFMHFWANDDAQKLARGLKVALRLVNVKGS
jgi:hypothetical protein